MQITVNHVISFNLPAEGQSTFLSFFHQLLRGTETIMSTLQDLSDKFDQYLAKRDEIDAAKDAASAEKDQTIADLLAQHATDVAAGVDSAAAIKALQDGVDAAVAKEQAALDALTPPVPPTVDPVPPTDPVVEPTPVVEP